VCVCVCLCVVRLKSSEILSNLLRSVIALSPDNLLHCVYLCLNRLAPAYEAIELGIGETVLLKVLPRPQVRLSSNLDITVIEYYSSFSLPSKEA